MSASPIPKFMTVEEYLEHERHAELPSEYYNGEIFPMPAVTRHHVLIAGNVGGALKAQLKGKPCLAYGAGLMVRIVATGLFTYPDVAVICGEAQPPDPADFVTNPTLIVEVLSRSTEDYDRGKKFEMYRTIPTLVDYLTISQDRVHVAQWWRKTENRGLFVDYTNLAESIELGSVGCALALADIYDGIEWPKPGA